MHNRLLLLMAPLGWMVVATSCQQATQPKNPAPAAAATASPAAPAKVEIALAPPLKAAIQKATPSEKYAYYVVKGMEPKTAADLVTRRLFVCCRLPIQDVEPIITAALPSLKEPLFAGVQSYGRVEGFLPGPGKKPTDPCVFINRELHLHKGEEVPLKELDFCGRATTEPQVLAIAIQDMRAAGNGVLLLPRDSQAPAPDFAEVVFQ